MRTPVLLLLATALAASALAQDDAGYTKKIRDYTTEKFFLTELVDHLPASTKVPTPEKFLGHIAGAPDILTYSADVNRYMRALEKATQRVKVFSIGKSEEGREMILVAVSEQKNLQNLDHYKSINALLGDPRKTNDSRAEKLIKEGLPMYWATGAMHSPESGSPEMLMELAYRLAVEETPFIKSIRRNSILLITPVLETDGRDRYVDTYLYRKKNPKKTPIPLVYWGHYVAHDDNRDAIGLSLALSQNVMKTWLDYRPLVLHDLHESVPYLYISTGTGPYNAWLDPITIDEWHTMAYNEIEEMTKRGVPGVWTHGFYDGWAANYMFYAANGHNAIGRFYETFGGSGADTGIRPADNSDREWDRPFPPFPKVRWSIRDNVNLQQSGLLFALKNVADNRDKFLRNYYLKSKRSVAKAATEGPAAYVISGKDHMDAQFALVRLLQKQGVEVRQLLGDAKVGAATFSNGSYVIRMDQPYSRMADMLLDKQYYNPNDPTPYDDTGWTLGPLFNVNVARVVDKAVLQAKMYPAPLFTENGLPGGGMTGNFGQNLVFIRPAGNFNEMQVLARLQKYPIERAEEEFSAADTKFPSGTYIVRTQNDQETMDVLRTAFSRGIEGERFSAIKEIPKVRRSPLRLPRIALIHTWSSTQDEGWARLALEDAKVPYDYISVHTLRDTADLRSKYDVILFPQTRGNAQNIVNGRPKDGDPIPWKPLPGFPNLGGPDKSDDIRGGIELQGMVNLQKFVQGGGLLVCIGNTCQVPIDYGLVSGVSITPSRQLRVAGSVLVAENNDKTNPAMAGYGDTVGVYFNQAPILSAGGGGFGPGGPGGPGGSQERVSGRGDLKDPDVIQGRPPYLPETKPGDTPETPNFGQPNPAARPKVLLRFAPVDRLLLSGMLLHGEELAGKAAVVLCPVGKGNVMLMAINPFWRHETIGSWPMVFDAALNYDRLQSAPFVPKEPPKKG